MISKIQVIDFILKHSSNFSNKQLKIQNETNAQNDYPIELISLEKRLFSRSKDDNRSSDQSKESIIKLINKN